MKRMTAYSFFTLAFLTLAGIVACSKQEEEGLLPIRFTCAPLVEVTTKANSSFIGGSGPLNNGQHFGVYAWNTGNSYLTSNPGSPGFISTAWDVQFTNNEDKGANNEYDPVNFWPRSSGYDYSFAAYYPYEGAGITPSFPAGTVGQYSFTAQSTAASMVDFCVSDIANDMTYATTNSGYDGTVQLTFRHTLCRVQFKFIKAQDLSDDFHIKILDAKLKNVKTTGTLTATYAPPSSPAHGVAGTTTLEWDGVGTLRDYEITINGVDPDPAHLPSATEVEIGHSPTLATRDVFLMIPDEVRPGNGTFPQQLWLQWKVGDEEPTTTELWLSDCIQAIGNDTPANIHWETNSFVTYTIVIGARPIDFSTSVTITSWDAEPEVNGYYPIIM